MSQVRPVHYYYKANEFPGRGFGTEREVGFIAQELREVYPDLVETMPDGYLKVRYDLAMTMESIAAIKELKADGDRKDAEIARLQAEAAQLQASGLAKDAEIAKVKAESAKVLSFLCGKFPEAADQGLCDGGD